MAQGPLADALLELDAITRRLRRECPWDSEQDERSIVPHTVEEAYELADAAHAGDDAKLLDELGDVLFQVYFLSLLLEERGAGSLAQVAGGTVAKLVRRHPHVFGEGDALSDLPTGARTASEVRENWDAIKRTEAGANDPLAPPGHLPALTYARKLQRRLEGDAPHAHEALARLERVVGEAAAIETAGIEEGHAKEGGTGSEKSYAAIGDLLLGAVALARSMNVDPEIALRAAADRARVRTAGASGR
jgi:uncharacterized protein YabN with tetrapyrrole methylase and pyrophosphatase domain